MTSATGEAPTATRVLLRAAAYVLVGQSTGLVQSVWGSVTVPAPLNLMSVWLPYLLLWSTMNRRNGFAGLHELVTGTRVVVAPERPRAVVENRALEPTGDARSGHFGPYEVVGAVWSQEDEALLVARDPALDRPVWIHTYDDPEGRLPVERLVEPSPHRLVWLQGTRAKRPCWDAYGAPSGRSLMGWLEEDGRLGWGVMGRVLAGVADELASNRVERLGSFTAGRVWIDGAGVPRVLDFPVRHEPDGRPRGIGTPEDIGVLRELAVLGLEGSVRSGSVGAEGPRVPLAAHAREWMRLLFADETSATELLRSRLEHSLARPPSITPARRFVAVLLGAGFVAPMLLMGVLLTTLGRATPGMVEVLSVPALVQEIRGPVGVGVGAAARRDAAVTLLLNAREAIGREPGLEELIRGMLEQGRFGMEWEELVQFMDSLASVAPPPGPEAVERARRLRGTGLGGEGLATLLAVVLLQVGVVATLLAFLFRGGPMLSLLGIEVQRWDGSRASRLRCLGRTALAWSPFLVLPPLFLVLGRMGLTRSGFALSFAGTAFVVALFGIVNELVIPERGLQDRLARVHLMPK